MNLHENLNQDGRGHEYLDGNVPYYENEDDLDESDDYVVMGENFARPQRDWSCGVDLDSCYRTYSLFACYLVLTAFPC